MIDDRAQGGRRAQPGQRGAGAVEDLHQLFFAVERCVGHRRGLELGQPLRGDGGKNDSNIGCVGAVTDVGEGRIAKFEIGRQSLQYTA